MTSNEQTKRERLLHTLYIETFNVTYVREHFFASLIKYENNFRPPDDFPDESCPAFNNKTISGPLDEVATPYACGNSGTSSFKVTE